MLIQDSSTESIVLKTLERCENDHAYLMNRRIYFQKFESIFSIVPRVNKIELYEMDECVNKMIEICIALAICDFPNN